jgi:hypothetical protein
MTDFFEKPKRFFLPWKNLLVLWQALLLLAPSSAFPQNSDSREYILKAGFIYNFTKFIQWPTEIQKTIEQEDLVFCLAGKDPFGNTLDNLSQGLREKGKGFSIIRNPDKKILPSCNILFVSRSENKRVENWSAGTKNYPILLIGDTTGYAQKGVGINFYIEGNKIRFEINSKAIERRGIRVSSELLNLAKIVGE